MSDSDYTVLRHSVAHVMAYALTKLYPDVQLAIGPSISDGFYYDVQSKHKFNNEDFSAIEEEMRAIIAQNLPFVRREISRDEAKALFADQIFKQEILADIDQDQTLSTYTLGEFVDLCRGPHVGSTAEMNPSAIKLMSVAGAYWRGDEKRPQLQRIYGTAFATETELNDHIVLLELMEKRDHRRIGKDQDLFSFHEEAGAGLAYWHPMGARIRVAIEDYWRKIHYEQGYELIFTPHVGKSWLWETSGHLDFYAEGMYAPMDVDGQAYYVKPMNCPFHVMIYNNDKKSYRQLPCRWAELGTVYRYERAGALHGMMRVRGFTQDDAHIICTPAQLDDEIVRVLEFSLQMLRTFGFTEIKPFLSTRPAEKSVGEKSRWDAATEALKRALEQAGLAYGIDEGGGAFYGPKIDLKVKDSMNREWQLSTIQVDFNLPERFNMVFIDSDGTQQRPYMVHRALLGSIERFFGVLIEHYGGAFPLWLSPVQVKVVAVSPKFYYYAQQVTQTLRQAGLRAEADLSDERMNAKIKKANELRIPYTLIVGGRDAEAGTASVKVRGGEDRPDMKMEQIVSFLKDKDHLKDLTL